MSTSNAPNTDPENERNLQLRDWILLPVVSAITIVVLLAGGLWLVIHNQFVFSKSTIAPCIGGKNSESGIRGIPNSVCQEKTPESELVEYRFNSCGDRTTLECGPNHSDDYRIVLIGASYAMGYRVRAEDSFAERLSGELSRRTGRRIEIYNASLAAEGGSPDALAKRSSEFTALKPDLILWVLGSWELNPVDGPVVQLAYRGGDSRWNSFLHSLDSSLVADYIRHFLYQSQSLYISAYLRGSPGDAIFLAAIPTTEELERMRLFQIDSASIVGRANSAGVPVVATFLPNRAEAAMISSGDWPVGIDPYRLDNDLRAAVLRSGGSWVDIAPAFRTIPNPERLYYPVDTHLDPRGHAVVASLLANALTDGAIPTLIADEHNQSEKVQKK